MTDPLIARARFALLQGEVSGKTRGYLSNVRPNHYIAEPGHTVIGNVEFEGGGIQLGETKLAIISYVHHESLARVLVPGLRYEVREGSRTVGLVEILETDGSAMAWRTRGSRHVQGRPCSISARDNAAIAAASAGVARRRVWFKITARPA